MNTKQIVVSVNMEPIIAQAFVESTEIDPGLSQGILVRLLRDHIQAAYPSSHVSVGLHSQDNRKLMIYAPPTHQGVGRRICEIFSEILQRANWLITV